MATQRLVPYQLTNPLLQSVIPGGRLTLTTGVPVTITDVIGATTVYYTPYLHNVVTLWDGTTWLAVTFSEVSLALGTLTTATPYDVFGFLSSGALSTELLEWLTANVTISNASPGVITWTAHGLNNGDPVVLTTTGTLPTGLSPNTQYWALNVAANTFQLSATFGGAAINTSSAGSGTHTGHQSRQRATTVTVQDGRYCKNGDKTRLYLGTFYTTSTTTTEDSAGGTTTQVGGKRFVWNAYNRALRAMAVKDTTGSWGYSLDAYRQANGAAGNKVEYVTGLDAIHIGARASAPIITNGDVSGWAGSGIGIDSITVESGVSGKSASYTSSSANIATSCFAAYSGLVAAGYHYVAWLDYGNSTGSNLVFGGSQGGLTAEVHA